MKVAQLLHAQGYSLQSNRKTEEGGDHLDRDAQFRHINAEVTRALSAGTPVISVDTKKNTDVSILSASAARTGFGTDTV
jgi:hypothetical protein